MNGVAKFFVKILVWGFCFFVVALIKTAFLMSGIFLGAIPNVLLFAGAMWLAGSICKSLNGQKEDAATEPNAPVSDTLTERADMTGQTAICDDRSEEPVDHDHCLCACEEQTVQDDAGRQTQELDIILTR